MADDAVDLDKHRGMAAQKATDLRRLRIEVEEDHAALKARQDELEGFLLAARATTWPEAVEKARYLLGLFAATSAGEDPRRQRLVKELIADFEPSARRSTAEARLTRGAGDAPALRLSSRRQRVSTGSAKRHHRSPPAHDRRHRDHRH